MSSTRRFWQEDIKIARDYNKTLTYVGNENLGNEFLKEWAVS